MLKEELKTFMRLTERRAHGPQKHTTFADLKSG